MPAANKKRKKASRMRGSKTHGVGFMKKGRGSGHRGGVGMAGTGKRADHKKSLILNWDEKYFGRASLKAKPKNYIIVNVSDLEKLANGKKELMLEQYKILGSGEIKVALTIHAMHASGTAMDKVKKAGGKIIVEDKPLEKDFVKENSRRKVSKEDKEVEKETPKVEDKE